MTFQLVDKFYSSFADRDGDAMADCYSASVRFQDPAFGTLYGNDAKDMWRMLCSSSTDLEMLYTIVDADATSAHVDWVAVYTFGPKKRTVTNCVSASISIVDNKIIEHHDSFDSWNWSRQALGLRGRLLGWSRPFQSKIQETATGQLKAFQQKRQQHAH